MAGMNFWTIIQRLESMHHHIIQACMLMVDFSSQTADGLWWKEKCVQNSQGSFYQKRRLYWKKIVPEERRSLQPAPWPRSAKSERCKFQPEKVCAQKQSKFIRLLNDTAVHRCDIVELSPAGRQAWWDGRGSGRWTGARSQWCTSHPQPSRRERTRGSCRRGGKGTWTEQVQLSQKPDSSNHESAHDARHGFPRLLGRRKTFQQ